ncbi:MAG: VOC family protein [Labilithrix sp.]|nr:VOC family protein [Labilithrix sp.]MCW5831193.1 VOC family protein [Labilithrix sp.]
MIRGGAVALGVSDVGRAVRFYVETLGMKLVREAPDGSAIVDAGEGFQIALSAGGAGAPSASVQLYPKVPIDEAIAIYENRGVSFTIERTEGRVVARFQDPDANSLALVQAA